MRCTNHFIHPEGVWEDHTAKLNKLDPYFGPNYALPWRTYGFQDSEDGTIKARPITYLDKATSG